MIATACTEDSFVIEMSGCIGVVLVVVVEGVRVRACMCVCACVSACVPACMCVRACVLAMWFVVIVVVLVWFFVVVYRDKRSVVWLDRFVWTLFQRAPPSATKRETCGQENG